MSRHTDHEGREASAGPLFEFGDPTCRYVAPADCTHAKLDAAVSFSGLPVRTISDLEAASLRRDLGMSRAAHAAERAAPGWEEQAISDLRTFARGREHFSVEDFREAFPPPADVNPKALGGVVKRAQRLGIVKADGFVLVKCSNLSPRTNWKSLVFEASA